MTTSEKITTRRLQGSALSFTRALLILAILISSGLVGCSPGTEELAMLDQSHQIVPADWVHDSLRTYSKDAWEDIGCFRAIGYGYHWWSARAGEHHVNFAWGHGGRLIVLVDKLNLVVVVTADPLYLVHTSESWKHEKAHISLVADFISSLPGE